MIQLTETARFELGPNEEEIIYGVTPVYGETNFGTWEIVVHTGAAGEPASIDIAASTAQDDYLRAACLAQPNKPANWLIEISLRFATVNTPNDMRELATAAQHLADICEKVQDEIIPHL